MQLVQPRFSLRSTRSRIGAVVFCIVGYLAFAACSNLLLGILFERMDSRAAAGERSFHAVDLIIILVAEVFCIVSVLGAITAICFLGSIIFGVVSRAVITRRVSVPGARLHVVVRNSHIQRTVLCFNGANCASPMWDLAAEYLGEKFRIVQFDVRGTGRSVADTNPTHFTMERYAQDIDAILDKLGVTKTFVWSMAWGSRVAMAYSALRPERVEAAAFFDASVEVPDVAAQREGSRVARRRQVGSGIPPFPLPDDWATHRQPGLVSMATQAIGKFDLSAEVEKISAPVLLATGDCDPNLKSSRNICDRLKRAKLHVMDNVGHGSVLQRPDLAAKLFLRFVTSN